MRRPSALLALLLSIVLIPGAIAAQTSQSVSTQSVPRLIKISGVFRPADGQPAGAAETVTLSIYAAPEGGTPLWQETQTIAIDAQGRYSLLLGASLPDGIPAAVFGGEAAHWLGTVFERAGEAEGPRSQLTSVPYAIRAADADTLGGRPASEYVLAPGAGGTTNSRTAAASESSRVTEDVVLPGTTNFLAKYLNSADVGNSTVFEAADGSVGMGTTTPFDRLHVRYNNNTGDFTGLAVQNMNGGALAYSGMLFFDHTNALTQFQGYNNSTHEYRINNIARVTPGGAFNGSINFMLGGTSKFIVAPNGNIGMGTTTPSAHLEVSNAISGQPVNMWMTSYTNAVNPYYMARRARGTVFGPTAVQNGDALAGFYGDGYGTTGFGPGFAGGMTVQAVQNWTDTSHGTALTFTTTPINSTTPTTRMTLDPTGLVGIGTLTTPAASLLEVSNAATTQPFGQVTTTTYANSGQGSLFVGRKARGTPAAPAAVQGGDVLAGVLGRGYGATNFNGTGNGGMFVRAAETWTDTAQGTSLAFNTTANGTTTPATRVTVTPAGDVGIGTANPEGTVEAVKTGDAAVIAATSYNLGCCAGFLGKLARGTPAAPAAVHVGDALVLFQGDGYGTTEFSSEAAQMIMLAAENWTDTAHGTVVAFTTTPLGSTESVGHMGIMPDGNVGIGTFTEIPTIADKLQVFGDIRVGTTGTNGCLRNFAGTGIAGACSSDRRLKKDITPFAPVLGQLTALQPVHYNWRSEEFPARHFGTSRAYGLIAQDVEQVLPELVATESDGYKAIDYSKLPLLTVQAVKELKAENDARKAENDALKQRVAELERLITELVANGRR